MNLCVISNCNPQPYKEDSKRLHFWRNITWEFTKMHDWFIVFQSIRFMQPRILAHPPCSHHSNTTLKIQEFTYYHNNFPKYPLRKTCKIWMTGKKPRKQIKLVNPHHGYHYMGEKGGFSPIRAHLGKEGTIACFSNCETTIDVRGTIS